MPGENDDLTLLDTLIDPASEAALTGIVESEYHRQLRIALDDALEHLEDADSRIMEQYYYFGLSFREIAETMGTSVPAVEARHRKALNRLRRSSHRRRLVPFMYWYSDEACFQATGFSSWERMMDRGY